MGYTHYFTQKQSFTTAQWAVVQTLTNVILNQALNEGIKIVKEYDEPAKAPFIGAKHIQFNGVDDEGHETFWLPRARPAKKAWHDDDTHGFLFCKTAMKPYDTAVTAVLILISSTWPTHFSIGSDGDVSDWQAGLALAQRALPELAANLTIPVVD